VNRFDDKCFVHSWCNLYFSSLKKVLKWALLELGCMNCNAHARKYLAAVLIAFTFLHIKVSDLYSSDGIIVPFGSDLLLAQGSRDLTARAALHCRRRRHGARTQIL